MPHIIETHNLSKTYPGGWGKPPKHALDALTLTVNAGEIFGYLGPNGAGKTTTIRLLLDFIRPTAGHALIFGMDTRRESVAIKRRVGNLPGELSLWDTMTGEDAIRYLAALRPNADLPYAFALAERLNLNTHVPIGDYSTGNKRKVGIIQALMHRPELVFLDEPTNGLDPLIRQTFMELLEEIRNEGRTVFLSSHILSEAQTICDRVAILRAGQLVTVEDVKALRRAQGRWMTIYTDAVIPPEIWWEVAHVEAVKPFKRGVQLRISGSMDAVIKTAAHYPIDDIDIDEPDLEEIFMKYYERQP